MYEQESVSPVTFLYW